MSVGSNIRFETSDMRHEARDKGSKASSLKSQVSGLESKIGAVLVVGGGIGGIQASLDLANSGIKVYLLDNSSTIGGVMAQLDKTFPTNDCSMCIMAPKLVECGRHLNIEKITNARVKSLAGEAGNFQVTVVERSRYVDLDKCTGCGVCAESCPVGARDAYNEQLGDRAGIYMNYPQAVPRAYIIDKDKCIGCGLCENLCLANAVKYTDSDKEMTLNVGAIILSPGFEEFEPSVRNEYGYGKFSNVVTSIEFERILSASGPYKGHVLRPSDGDIPKKIAFIQCVGSRDSKCQNEYCSSVCCMYSIKEAVIAKEHQRDVEPAIFFMDMRAYGKDFDKYYERAQDEYGVRFVRSRVASVKEIVPPFPKGGLGGISESANDAGNLLVKYETEDGKVKTEDFDLVVLSVGFEPPRDAEILASDLGIELNEYGFCKSDDFYPVATTKPGIFVCGAFSGPKDIPETVTQASAAACKVGDLLADARGSLVQEKEYPEEINVEGERPRIGVFICHCGINIGGYVDVPSVVEYAESLPYVAYAERNLYTCSQDTQEKIKEKIKEHNLNRIIVASCSPRTHEPLFQETIREAGLNRYLFEMANIRDQCSWVHMFEPEKATEKAKDLVRMAVAKAARLEPLQRFPLNVTKSALVIGGGLAGMVASLSLAAQGIETHLVEREEELGGNLKHIHSTLDGKDIQAHLRELIDSVDRNELINVYKGSEIKEISGYVGNFETTIDLRHETGDMRLDDLESQVSSLKSVKHGVVIVATGAKEYEPDEYLYGQDPRVVTQSQLEQLIAEIDMRHETGDTRLSSLRSQVSSLKSVVMIQCVGSRDENRPYCSRFCCSQAIKNALSIKEKSPDTNVFILYRDMRTYGFREGFYQKAREAGVIFVRYDLSDKPEVYVEDGKLYVLVTDPIIGEKLLLEPDLLALSVAAVPNEDSEELAQMLRVPLNADGFFLEAHVKLRPVDFATEGIFVCGLCHSPKSIEETIDQACAAVSRATTILSSDVIYAEGSISQVDITRCTACGMCETVCAYKAIEVKVVDERRGIKAAQINEALCKGCGVCAANCRCEAIDVRGFTDEQIFSMINAL
jgi:heterodisulfide reductase subunit A